VRFTHHVRVANILGVFHILGGIEAVVLVRGTHPTGYGHKNVLGSSFKAFDTRMASLKKAKAFLASRIPFIASLMSAEAE